MPFVSAPEDKKKPKYEENIIVKNEQTTKSQLNVEDYDYINNAIIALSEGSVLEVTYYSSLISKRQIKADRTHLITSATREKSDVVLNKITGFKMKTESSFSYNYDPERSESEATGTATTYPGFEPMLGDFFFYTLNNSQIGIFIISSKEPLSYFNERAYRVTFYLHSLLDDTEKENIEAKVKQENVFVAENLLNHGEPILEESSYTQTLELNRFEDILINIYLNRYFNKYTDVFYDDQNRYDPYLTQFILTILEFRDLKTRPKQIYVNPELNFEFSQTVLGRLIDEYYRSLDNLIYTYNYTTTSQRITDIHLNQLTDVNYIKLADTNVQDHVNEPYIFSNEFYNDNDALQDGSFEKFVSDYIKTRKLNKKDFIMNHLRNYQNNTEVDFYYLVPILIFFIKTLKLGY